MMDRLLTALANVPSALVTRLLHPGPGLNVPADLSRVADQTIRMEKLLARIRSSHRLQFLPLLEGTTQETDQMRALYRTMLRDPYVKASLLTKILAVAALEVQVQPASESLLDKDIAEFVKHNLTRKCKGGTSGIVRAIATGALIEGFSVCEPRIVEETHGRWAGMYTLAQLKSKDPQFLQILGDSYRNITGVRDLRTMDEWDPSEFVIYQYLPIYESPFGMSDLRAAYRAFVLVDTCWQLRAVALDRYSLPVLEGKYANKDQRPELEAALAQVRSQSWFTIPEDVQIQALDISTRGAADFQAAISDLREEIVIGITGATLQMLSGKVADARGDSSVHKDTSELMQWLLAADIQTVINDQLVPLLVQPNFGGAVMCPHVTFGGVNDSSLTSSVTVDTFLHQSGLDLSKEELYERYGRQKPTDPEDTLPGQGGMPGMPGGPGVPPAPPFGAAPDQFGTPDQGAQMDGAATDAPPATGEEPVAQFVEGDPDWLLDVPDVRQRFSFDCGPAAALAVDNLVRGKNLSLLDVIYEMGTTPKDGTPPPAIVKWFEANGCQVVAGQLTIEDLGHYTRLGWPVICPGQQRRWPWITSFEGGHYVVVRGADDETVWLQDPVNGPVSEPAREFARRWHDKDCNGKVYIRYGIAVGPPLTGQGQPADATFANDAPSALTAGMKPFPPEPGDPNVIRLSERPAREYGVAKFDFPAPLAERIRQVAAGISDEHLHAKGREDIPHITALFGLHDDNPDAIGNVLEHSGPVTAALGGLSCFETPEYDVVKIGVEGDGLHAMHRHLADRLDHTDTHPDYNPHITLGYVKPGWGRIYAGMDHPLRGEQVKLDQLTFSTRDRSEHVFPLGDEVSDFAEGDAVGQWVRQAAKGKYGYKAVWSGPGKSRTLYGKAADKVLSGKPTATPKAKAQKPAAKPARTAETVGANLKGVLDNIKGHDYAAITAAAQELGKLNIAQIKQAVEAMSPGIAPALPRRKADMVKWVDDWLGSIKQTSAASNFKLDPKDLPERQVDADATRATADMVKEQVAEPPQVAEATPAAAVAKPAQPASPEGWSADMPKVTPIRKDVLLRKVYEPKKTNINGVKVAAGAGMLTNGHFILPGTHNEIESVKHTYLANGGTITPLDEKRGKESADGVLSKLKDYQPTPLKPFAARKSEDGVPIYAMAADGQSTQVDARYVATIMQRHPKATLHFTGKAAGSPLAIVENGKVIGALATFATPAPSPDAFQKAETASAPASEPTAKKVKDDGAGQAANDAKIPNSPIDKTTPADDNTIVPLTSGGGNGEGSKVKSTVTRYGRQFEVEHPEPLKNAAGEVTFDPATGRVRMALIPTEAHRAKGITSITSAPFSVSKHPTAGEGLNGVKTNKGSIFLSFANNPGVKELIDNAKSISQAVDIAARNTDPEVKADRELGDKMRAEAAEYEAKIPADHARVNYIKVGSLDGNETGRYEVDGIEVPWNHPEMIHHGTASAIRPGALGAFDSIVVHSMPKTAVAKLKADKAAAQQAKDDRAMADSRRVADLAAKAKSTGNPQVVDSWTQAAGDDDNSLNIVTKYVRPDGTTYITTTRTH